MWVSRVVGTWGGIGELTCQANVRDGVVGRVVGHRPGLVFAVGDVLVGVLPHGVQPDELEELLRKREEPRLL